MENINKHQHTFYEDLEQPLDKVQRFWIKRLVLIIKTPFFIIGGIIGGIIDILIKTYKDIW